MPKHYSKYNVSAKEREEYYESYSPDIRIIIDYDVIGAGKKQSAVPINPVALSQHPYVAKNVGSRGKESVLKEAALSTLKRGY